MKLTQLYTPEYIIAVLTRALESGNVRESDYLILDEDEGTLSVGPMGVSDGHNRSGFDIIHFIDFDEVDKPVIDDNAVSFLAEMLAIGL